MGAETKGHGRRRGAWRRWRLPALLLVLLVVTLGCNPLQYFCYFLTPDPRTPPDFKLSSDKKETKVVLWSSRGLDVKPELFGADDDLLVGMSKIMKKRYEEDKEKVQIVPPYQVKNYVNRELKAVTAYDVGEHFHADYVVNIEVNSMSLYRQGSFNQLFLGKAEIYLSVTDLSQPREAGLAFEQHYTLEYPKSGEIPVDGASPGLFRAQFLNRVATDLARYFTSSETKQDFD